jgi:uncharacterized membrane protein YhaH (DUF805 family)
MVNYLFLTRGRINRVQYWMGLLPLNLLVPFVLIAIENYAVNSAILGLFVVGGYFWIAICIIVKRLHDIGVSGWVTIGIVIMPLGALVIGFWPGTSGANLFGPDPGVNPQNRWVGLE